jgi:hypothetical protein
LTREAFLLGCLYYSFRPSEQEPIPKKLADAFYNIAVTDTDAGPIPALSLLLDPEAVFDQVASILGANRHSMLMSLLPLERKEALRRIVSESTVTKTVAELEENSGSIDRWIRLHAVLGGSIIPDSHLPKLGAIILKSDFASFVASNPEKGLMPILLASMHVRHLNNSDIREHLLATLLASARLLRKSGGCTRAEGSVQLVIETALNISLCSPRASSVLDEFGRIIQSICNEWPAATEFARLVIQSLCEDLPLGEGDALWKLNLKLRSCA